MKYFQIVLIFLSIVFYTLFGEENSNSIELTVDKDCNNSSRKCLTDTPPNCPENETWDSKTKECKQIVNTMMNIK